MMGQKLAVQDHPKCDHARAYQAVTGGMVMIIVVLILPDQRRLPTRVPLSLHILQVANDGQPF